jgi:hypothetical protein
MTTTVSQPSLWDEPVAPGDMHEFTFSWADGDTSPSQLQRLAELTLKHATTGRDDNGKLHAFRCISVRIADGKVYGTCVLSPRINRADRTQEDDEEDEC